MHKITVEGIKVYAYHGCLEEESKIGSNYTVDVLMDTDFSEAAKDIRQSQTVFSQAANSFCLFVAEQPRQKIVVACEEDSSDDFLNHLLQQNEEDDALIESLGLDANHSTNIP